MRSLYHVQFVVALAASVAGCGGLRSTGPAAARIDLCTLIADSAAYSGQRVTVRANIRAGSGYAVVLYDDACAKSTVVLDVPAELEKRDDFEGMMKRVWGAYPEQAAQTSEVEVAGTFRFAPQDVPSRYILVRSLMLVEAQDAN